MLMLVLCLTVVAGYATAVPASEFRIVCYYSNWAQYRPGHGKFQPEHIDPDLCTHIIYFYSQPKGLDLAPVRSNDDVPRNNSMYTRVLKMKEKKSSLKILLSVANWELTSAPFLTVSRDDRSRKIFSQNVVRYLRDRHFDGFDMAWEHPGSRGGTSNDKENFLYLMEKLRAVFEQDARASGKPRLLLTVAVPANKADINRGYKVADLARVVDFMSIMTYSYHGDWDMVTGFNSPLFAHPQETGSARELNVDWSARYYVSLGAPKEKMNIALAPFGRSFTLKDRGTTGVFSPAKGAGKPGNYSRVGGFLTYYEVCDLINNGAQVVDDPSQGNRYLVKGDQWVSYDDRKSVIQKACYAKLQGFGGIIFRSIDYDDFSGAFCNEGKYPLIRTANLVRKSFAATICTGKEDSEWEAVLKENKSTEAPPSKFRVVCHYSNWAEDREVNARFTAEHVDPHLCTHLVFCFANVTGLNLVSSRTNDEDNGQVQGTYSRIIKLKEKNPLLKVLLAVGTKTENSEMFRPLIQTEESRKTFTTNVVSFLRYKKFDGFEIHWKYPGSAPDDKMKFQLLMKTLREVFESESYATRNPRLLLSVAVPHRKELIDNGYKIADLARVVDFMSIMSFNYHGNWEKVVGFNSPLYAHTKETGDARRLNVNWTALYYVSLGAPKKKLNIGIPTFGSAFILSDRNKNSVFSTATAAAYLGHYSKEAGLLAYYEVCSLFASGARQVDVPSQRNRYLVLGELWVGYEDAVSARLKACYARENGFGGILISPLDLDDFSGTFCKRGKYPLLTSVSVVKTEAFSDVCKDLSDLRFSTSRGTQNIKQATLVPLCLCLLMWSTL